MVNTPRLRARNLAVGPPPLRPAGGPELGHPRVRARAGQSNPSEWPWPCCWAVPSWDHCRRKVKLPSLLAMGFCHDSAGIPLGWRLASTAARRRCVMASLTLATRPSWLGPAAPDSADQHAGHRQRGAQLMSPPTLLALGTGHVGILLGLGDHTTAVLSLTRATGVLIITVMVCWLLLAVLRGRLHPGSAAWALRYVTVLFPVVQPWYLLWAITPLAAWATRPISGSGNPGHPHRRDFGPTATDRFALFRRSWMRPRPAPSS